MQLYHLGNSRYAGQLNGEGARLFGGRWNQKGDACIYTSGTRSLCILEYLANVSLEDIPSDLSFTVYNLSDKLCKTIPIKDLPDKWNSVPPSGATKQFGSHALADENCVCFAVPSVIISEEWNFILNPASVNFNQLKIISIERFNLDHRIKESN